MLYAILEAAILAASLSLDSFVAGFAYGGNKIKIPFLSVQIISIICSGIIGLSLLIGSFARNLIPVWLTQVLCFSILFVIGLVKLIDGVVKSLIRRNVSLNRQIEFSMFSLRFILSLYADPQKSDVDESKSISAMEAASLALALSLDGLAVGFGAAMGNANGLAVFLWSLVSNTAFIPLGCYLGKKIAHQVHFNLSWLCGAVLIIMAFAKIF